MSFQLQQGAIEAELRKAGFTADAAGRLARILGNSVQQVRSGPQTQDLTPQSMRKVTPHVRKYQLQNIDFLEGDPDYRRAQTRSSEEKFRPTQASTVRSDEIPQQSESSFRVNSGDFTDVKPDGDRVSVGLRVRKTGSFVTQDPTSGSLIGRNIRVQSQGGDKGFARLSLEEAGPDVIIKLQLDDVGLVNEAVSAATAATSSQPVSDPAGDTPDPCPNVSCASDSECGAGCICEDSLCTSADCGPDRRCPDQKLCVDGRCVECVTDAQCADGQTCSDGQCVECLVNADCPVGQTCVDGFCVDDDGGGGPVPACEAVQCGSDAECGSGCVCVAGACIARDVAYFCCYESVPVEGEPLPDAMCQLGPCFDGDGLDAPDLTASGPYATYEECCEQGCGCKYSCSAGSCIQSPQGLYDIQADCIAQCADSGQLGRCCEALPPNTSLNDTNCIIKRPMDGNCQVTRLDCPSEERDETGALVISRTWTSGLNCDSCPTTAQGACCLPDGSCETLCEGECEARGGTYKGASWSDCETERISSGGLYDFPCEDANGQGDCACDFNEKVVDAGSSSRCEPCGGQVLVAPAAGISGNIAAVSAGDSIDFYIRSCDSRGAKLAIPARVVTVRVDNGPLQTINVSGTFVADSDGDLILNAGAFFIVCYDVASAPPQGPQEVSCDQCCHSYSADFTNPPSCPDGWELALGVEAPSQCLKCEELPANYGEEDCPTDDENSPLVQEMVNHINSSADKFADVTAQDVLSTGGSGATTNHFVCPDERCYEGVTDIDGCPGDNPLP